MDFALSEEQEMLRNSARDFLTKECPKTLVRQMETDEKGYSPNLWKGMADLGWMGLVFPEAYGGSGMTFLDLAVLIEELGRAIVPCSLPAYSGVLRAAHPGGRHGGAEKALSARDSQRGDDY